MCPSSSSRTAADIGPSKKSDRASDACLGRMPAFVVRRHRDTVFPPHPARESAASRYAVVFVDRDVGAAPTCPMNRSRIVESWDGGPVHAPPTETLAPLEGIHLIRQLDQSSCAAAGAQL